MRRDHWTVDERHTNRSVIPRLAAVVLALVFAAAGTGPVHAAGRLLVFAAASLQGTLDEITGLFETTTGSKVTVSYAASSTLARQIEQGAPADVYISASPQWADALDRAQLLRRDTRTNLLRNRLVLVAPRDSSRPVAIEPRFPLASLLGNGRLAMADPAHVPAGIYAKAALQTLGVWNTLADRVVGTGNVRAALALVARGEARYGVVYRTDARAEPGVTVVGVFPEASHPPILYPAAIPAGSVHPRAPEFLAFLRSDQVGRIFAAHGFVVLEQ